MKLKKIKKLKHYFYNIKNYQIYFKQKLKYN